LTHRSASDSMHPLAAWPWWRVLALSVGSFGFFGLIVAFFPDFSPLAATLGAILVAGGIAASMWNWMTYDWWARVLTAEIWSLMLVVLSYRSLGELIQPSWLVAGLVVLPLAMAWLLPGKAPRVSAFLWREQTTPQTTIGRWLLVVCVALVPLVGILGVSFGMAGSRFGKQDIMLAAAGSIGLLAAWVVSFATAYQLWPSRPWARNRGT
jgi:hypothetical protein